MREPNLDPGLPAIAFTVFFTEADRQQCFAAGIDEIVAKPIRLEDFTMVWERCLAKMTQTQRWVWQRKIRSAESLLRWIRLVRPSAPSAWW